MTIAKPNIYGRDCLRGAGPRPSFDDEDGGLAGFGVSGNRAAHEVPAGWHPHELGHNAIGRIDGRCKVRHAVNDDVIGSAPGPDLEADHAVPKVDLRRLPGDRSSWKLNPQLSADENLDANHGNRRRRCDFATLSVERERHGDDEHRGSGRDTDRRERRACSTPTTDPFGDACDGAPRRSSAIASTG
jgi:hypothetical protein